MTDTVVEKIQEGIYDVIILNFANPDMVGHTGVFEATVKAVETVDKCIGKVVEAIKELKGTLLITADHGNAEQIADYDTGEPYTAHTCNPVPLILIGRKPYKLKCGNLADIAPTMLHILNIQKPVEMTGNSLLEDV